MLSFLRAAVLAASFVASAFSPANALVVGIADTTSSLPFGSTTSGYYFQQIYSASSFSSLININDITFYNSLAPGGTPRAGSFDIYLSVTSANVATFDTSNGTTVPYYDASFANVYHGTLPTLADGKLDFQLLSSFAYDPSAGNLLLTIKSNDLFDGSLFLDADKNNGFTNIRMSSYGYDFNQGLVTGFNAVAAVPEPSTWAMIILGFAGIAFISYDRKRKHVAAVAV
jgi:hypothetical protein